MVKMVGVLRVLLKRTLAFIVDEIVSPTKQLDDCGLALGTRVAGSPNAAVEGFFRREFGHGLSGGGYCRCLAARAARDAL